MLAVLYLLIAFAFLSYLASTAFVYLNTINFTDLFFNSTLDIDQKYFQLITPDGIVFTIIWPVIYLWNVVGILYLVAGAFIPPRMSPVKMSPTITPAPFLAAYAVTFLMNVGWVFAYDAEILPLSLGFLAIGSLISYITLGITCKNITDNRLSLEIKGNVMMWMMRVFVHNGLGVLAAWLTFSTVVNLVNVILFEDSFYFVNAQERGLVTREVGSLIGLGVLLALIIVWFVLENFVWEKYCRYTFTIYPVFLLALSGLIVKLTERFREDSKTDVSRVLIFASVDLAVCAIAFIFRIVLFLYKYRARAALSAYS